MITNKEKLKSLLIQLLDKFVDVCEANQIQYYLAWGSVLGAVRHKGIIPWDDDIDVYLPRKDYERLQMLPDSIWGESFMLASWKRTKGYYYHFLKLEMTSTTVVEVLNPLYVGGIYIDIFPLDDIDLNNVTAQMQLAEKYLQRYYYLNIRKKSDNKNLVSYIKHLYRNYRLRFTHFLDDWDRVATSFKGESQYYIDFHAANEWKYQPLPKNIFGDGMRFDFEGRAFIIPQKYDEYLTFLYGDYMTPPPIDKRGGHEWLYINLEKRLTGRELRSVVKKLQEKSSFKFSLGNELEYWKQKIIKICSKIRWFI